MTRANKEELEKRKLELEIKDLEKKVQWGWFIRLGSVISALVAVIGIGVPLLISYIMHKESQSLEDIISLRKELTSESPAVRSSAVSTLAEYYKYVLPTLFAILRHQQDPVATDAVKESFKKLGKKETLKLAKELKRFYGEIIRILEDSPADMQRIYKEELASNLLGKINNQEVFTELYKNENLKFLHKGYRDCAEVLTYLLKRHSIKGLDLEGINLSGGSLEEINLEKANLQRATLDNANLSKANLTAANLNGASLKGSKLEEAVLIGCDLSDAVLEGSSLQFATFTKANLFHANFSFATLDNANLSGSFAQHTDFLSALLRETKMRGADLCFANFKYANLSNAILENANLQEAILENANCFKVVWKKANLTGAYMLGINNFQNTENNENKLKGARLNSVKGLKQEDLDYAQKHGAVLH